MERTVTVYTYPTAASLRRIVVEQARKDGIDGRITIVRIRPRAGRSDIRQNIDVDITVS